MKYTDDKEHESFYCEVHKKLILFFKRDIALRGYHCWDCVKEMNDKSWKASQTPKLPLDKT